VVVTGGVAEGPPARRTSSAGSATVELVVLAPVVVLFALVMVALGRAESVRAAVAGAARAGAEAAATSAGPVESVAAAQRAVVASLSWTAADCHHQQVAVDATDFVPGGAVAVSVTCTVPLADLGVPGLPGTVVFQHQVSAPIDPYRVVP
jgi:Flp pilus assembly protein TadG